VKYEHVYLCFRDAGTLPPAELKKSFVACCRKKKIACTVIGEGTPLNVNCRCAYIVISDDDLAAVVSAALNNGLTPGRDIGIIAYNDTPLKAILAGGISVISADVFVMGVMAAQMIIGGTSCQRRNPAVCIDRGSF